MTEPGPGTEVDADARRVAERGLAGAAAVGRDVDGGSGARSLSGRLGTVTASRELWGARRTWFRYVAHVVTWTPGETSWTFFGPRPTGYETGVTTFAVATPEHPDQLSGRRHAIATALVEVERPGRVVRSWAWLDQARPGVTVPPEGTLLTATLRERTDAEGDPLTTVTFRHEGLPVEWLDDLQAWWDYQLDMADFRDLGSA